MNIILFGSHGQLGAALLGRLGQSHSVKAYTHTEVDIRDCEKVAHILHSQKPHLVINATAMHLVSACEDNPTLAFEVNAIAVGHMSRVSSAMGSMFMTFSTDYIFNGTKRTPYGEQDTPMPVSIYGVSKVAGEIMAQWNPKTYLIRTAGLYGGASGSREKGGNFVLTILKQSAGVKRLEVASEQITSTTYAIDLADGIAKLIDSQAPCGAYHMTNRGSCSWAQFAQEIVSIIGRPCKIIPVDRGGESGGAKRPLYSVLSGRKLQSLGIHMPSWRDAVRRYMRTLPI